MGPESNERVLIRNRNRTHRERHRKEGHVKTEEEIDDAAASQGTPGATRLEAARKGQELMPPWGLLICGTSREYISIVNLWHFVTAAPCNEDTYHPKFSTLAP